MKKAGCAIAVLGAILVIAGVLLLVPALVEAAGREPAEDIPLAVGEQVTGQVAGLSTEGPAALGVELTVTGPVVESYVQTKDRPGGRNAPYRVPLSYRVLDAEDREIASGQVMLPLESWTTSTYTDAELTVRQTVEKFRVPASDAAAIGVEATLGANEVEGAGIADARLLVYEDLPAHGLGWGWPAFLVVFGALMALGGLVAFLVGLFLPGGEPYHPEAEDTVA